MSEFERRARTTNLDVRYNREPARASNAMIGNLLLAIGIALLALLFTVQPGSAASPQQTTATCTVQAARLNLRVGPGTNYRSDQLLDRGTTLRATGRNSASTWIKVTVTGTGVAANKQGWVAYGAQLATCTSAISRLPVATAPPATGANAATPATGTSNTGTSSGGNTNPRPLPAPIALAPLPTGGGGAEDLQGELVTDQDDFDLEPNPNAERPNDPNAPDYIVFSDRINLALDITRRPSTGPITLVNFTLTEDETGETVWAATIDDPQALRTDPYCFFGGEPDECVEVDLRAGATWPLSDTPVRNGRYSLSMDAENTPRSDEDSISSRLWFGTIVVDSSRLRGGSGGNTTSSGSSSASVTPTPTLAPPVANRDPVIEFIETEPGTNATDIYEALTFQVAAWDPDFGFDDGDGIDYLYMDVNDPDGNVVAWVEYNAPLFCGFGEDDGGCGIWWFYENDYTWPNGDDILYGVYTLYVNAVSVDGGESEATLDVVLQ